MRLRFAVFYSLLAGLMMANAACGSGAPASGTPASGTPASGTTAAAAASAAAVYGGATPEEVVAGLQKAAKANDFLGAISFISPDGRKELANEGVTGVVMVLAFTDPDDPMPGGKSLSEAELAAKRKSYKEAMELAKATLKPHGLDGFIGKPAMSDETQKAIDAALSKADTVALMTSLMGAMEKMGPMLGMTKKAEGPKMPFNFGTVTDYQIAGDKATAKNGAETLDFVKIENRWFISPPKPPAGK